MTARKFLPFLPVLLLALLALSGLSSCGENALTKATREHREAFAVADDDSIQSYLRANNYTTYTRTDDGVYIVPLVKGPGTGPDIVAGKQVRVKYIGRIISVNPLYLNRGTNGVPGNIFDNSSDNHTTCGCAIFTIGSGIVAGFSEGLTYLHQGDRALLLIPSQQAYGPSAVGAILPDSSLAFDVEILEVSP